MMTVNLYIADPSGTKEFGPNVEEGIEWSTERSGVPGKLTFRVLKDEIINFREGAAVRLIVDEKPVFYGYVFTKSRDKNRIITVTAYDQLRYLKNKDTRVFEGKTAAQIIKSIAADTRLKCGTITDTKFVIPSRVEENTSYFDMICNALDLTLQHTKEMYVLYDDFGKLTLKPISSMYVKDGDRHFIIDEESAENFDYSSSIDTDTYNQIKLAYNNEKTGKREIYMAKDSSHINEWGLLQYFDKLSKGENGQAKADALLKLYNKKTRKLTISKAFGDLRVRAGSMLIAHLMLGDMQLTKFMLVEKAKHIFQADTHFMDLILRGGEFVG